MKTRYRQHVTLFIFLMVFLALPTKSRATAPVFDYCTFAINLTISGLYGGLLDAVTDLTGIKEDGADEYVGNQQIIAAGAEANKTAQTGLVAALIDKSTMLDAVQKNNDFYSPMSQSSFACQSDAKGAGLCNGGRSLIDARDDIYLEMEDYNNTPYSPNDAYDIMAGVSEDGGLQTSIYMVPPGSALNDEALKRATFNAAILANPLMDFDPPQKYLDKPAGEKYQTMRRAKQAKVGLSQMAMSHIISRRAAIYPMEGWMWDMSRSIGILDEETNTPADLDNVYGGMTSAEAVLDMEVAIRYSNPQYVIDLHRKNKTGLLRELIAVEAVSMEFNRLELVNQQYLTALQASRSSTMAQVGVNDELNREYKGAILQKHE